MSSVIQESFDWRTKYRCIRETFFRYVENKMKTLMFTILFLISFTTLADTEAKIKRIAIIEDT